MKAKMKAIVAKGYGSPSVFQYVEMDRPTPGPNEVLVKVYTSSATAADMAMRTGKPYIARLFTGLLKPKHPIPGTGFAGVVDSVGAEVKDFKAGDRVFGETTLGFSTNAEYVAVPECGVILPMPESMSYEQGCSFCDGPLTSFNFLQEIAGLQKGQKVLINGASGSLGTAAVQIAKLFGTHVTAVCSGKNAGLVKSLGADEVIDYTQVDFTKSDEKYDVIYDTLGILSFRKCKAVMGEHSQFITPVLKPSYLWQMMTTKSKNQTVKFGATGMLADKQLRKMLQTLAELFKDGKVKVVIDRQYPLAKLAEAHEYVAGGHKKGNVVIVNV